MTASELFHVDPVPAAPLSELSPDARRTARQKQLVERGLHPYMGTRTRPDLGTCGDCVHRRSTTTNGNRSWPKCWRYPSRITHGAATDIRAWWPACDQFEKGA